MTYISTTAFIRLLELWNGFMHLKCTRYVCGQCTARRADDAATSTNNQSNALRTNTIISDDWLIGVWYMP